MSEYLPDHISRRSSLLDQEYSTPINPRALPPLSQANPAKWTYQKLVECINHFEKDLDNEHEVGARLVSFGSSVTFHLKDINFYAPDIICFCGINTHGEELQLIQHVSQLSVLLISMVKLDEEPVRIGSELQRAIEEEI